MSVMIPAVISIFIQVWTYEAITGPAETNAVKVEIEYQNSRINTAEQQAKQALALEKQIAGRTDEKNGITSRVLDHVSRTDRSNGRAEADKLMAEDARDIGTINQLMENPALRSYLEALLQELDTEDKLLRMAVRSDKFDVHATQAFQELQWQARQTQITADATFSHSGLNA